MSITKTKLIAILVLIVVTLMGVSVLAENYNQQSQVGPTCNSATLTVNARVGIEQGYVATAVSYNASFCGAPCPGCENTSNGPSIKKRLIQAQKEFDGVNYNSVHFSTESASGIVISGLMIESNSTPISVTVEVSNPVNSDGETPDGMSTYYVIFNSYDSHVVASPNNKVSPSTYPPTATLTIPVSADLSSPSDKPPYSGDVVVVLDTSDTEWGEAPSAGRYTITTTFTISPVNSY